MCNFVLYQGGPCSLSLSFVFSKFRFKIDPSHAEKPRSFPQSHGNKEARGPPGGLVRLLGHRPRVRAGRLRGALRPRHRRRGLPPHPVRHLRRPLRISPRLIIPLRDLNLGYVKR
ncbi:uncharacterized protein J3R85_000663 [Psidium guajava]|nr:uncharacterized protein J3R85_000663 [Psidium guajava]